MGPVFHSKTLKIKVASILKYFRKKSPNKYLIGKFTKEMAPKLASKGVTFIFNFNLKLVNFKSSE